MDGTAVGIQTMAPASGFTQQQLGYFQYENGVYPAVALRAAVDALLARDLKVVGLIQHESRMPGRSHCDMELEDIASGERIAISEERGAAARGCRLDPAGLAAAYMAARAGLTGDTDLVVISKFGKIEAEGGGLRDLIAEALEAGVPVLIGVPERNLASWQEFAGDMARQLRLDGSGLLDWLDQRANG
ncbi:DUF2478 domain-containing protein [Ferrovibrio xuzhouensis]|uniref:DUF2478 domain-containing protein n=1 Tax=Ferrovibrio xuzhouensis TaxID=1576914 RepID=A0ABV7VEI7_9PROT